MKPERMRVRIAEYLGAKWVWTSGVRYLMLTFNPGPNLVKPEDDISGFNPLFQDIPDYPNDLNACHEMEKALTRDQQSDYAELLADNFSEEFCDLAGTAEHIFACAHLTAIQRSEAFCRTVGIWEEEAK